MKLAGATAILALLTIIAAPLAGWPSVVRLPAVLVPVLAAAAISARPWRWTAAERDAIADWSPSPKTLHVAAAFAMAVLGWIVVTRFRSGDINAIDFTAYFDRPLYQTAHGRPLFVEVSERPAFSYRSQFAVHEHYILLALAPLYWLAATPYWLLLISVVAVVAGAWHTFRIVARVTGSGLLGAAAAAAFLLNANTARTLMYGFHPEVLYAWLIPATLHAAIAGRPAWFLAAVVGCAAVKEDACMPLFAVSTALALTGLLPRRGRALYLLVPLVIGFGNLAAYYAWVLPAVGSSSVPTYAEFWGAYGPTPMRALWGIAMQPVHAIRAVASSGIVRVLLPHALLPLVGWRWTIGTLPIIVLYAVSASEFLRDFALYYSIVLVPFLVIGSAVGGLTLARALLGRESSARLAAAAVILLSALLVYGDRAGYALRRWRSEVTATPQVMKDLSGQPAVLVQGALYPHAGYESRIVLLTRETLRAPKYQGVPTVLAPTLNIYPLDADEFAVLTAQPPMAAAPGGVLIVRRP